MSLGSRLFAARYDAMAKGPEEAGLLALREQLLSGVSGRVVEIGAGTGRNLAFYGDGVELTVTEPDPHMARRLEQRIEERSRPVKLVQAPAEDLPFEDGQFDVAVSTLVLCGVDDQARALGEVRRVLKPGGELIFIEHVRSDEPRLARWQDRLNPLNRVVARCNCNRRDGGRDPRRRLHDHEARARRAAEGAAVRPPARGRDGHAERRLTRRVSDP